MSTWGDSLKALFYGPGWTPGAHRLGNPDTFPDVKTPRIKYDPQLPLWQVVYVYSHLLLALLAQQLLVVQYTVSCSSSSQYSIQVQTSSGKEDLLPPYFTRLNLIRIKSPTTEDLVQGLLHSNLDVSNSIQS